MQIKDERIVNKTVEKRLLLVIFSHYLVNKTGC